MMRASEHIKVFVKGFESLKLKAYPDPKTKGDPWTNGWGITGPDIKRGTVWTMATAIARFDAAVAERDADLNRLLDGAKTTQAQYDALFSFGFNVGMWDVRRGGKLVKVKLQGSTLLRYHKAGKYDLAAKEFGKWINKGSDVERGLTRRRAAEAAMYLGVRP